MKPVKALRLIIHQNSANYKREETVENKMTYPLPPVSTIIGAIHNACGYREYKEMDISIQGKFESMHREPYTDYCFLNSVQDDRGILVKMQNGDMLCNAFAKVASAQKPQGNSFRNGVTINVHNQNLLEEYRNLKDLNDSIDFFVKNRIKPLLELIKQRKKSLGLKKKKLDKKSPEYMKISDREKEIKNLEKEIKTRLEIYKAENYTSPISRYRTLTTSLKFYEILDEITLILHIRAKNEILNEILDNIYNLQYIGRSEDFITVENAEIVELTEDADDEIISKYSAYIPYDLAKGGRIYLNEKKGTSGTRYYLNKKYTIVDKRREFEKVKALYTSDYAVDTFGDGIYLDEYNGEKIIVSFL